MKKSFVLFLILVITFQNTGAQETVGEIVLTGTANIIEFKLKNNIESDNLETRTQQLLPGGEKILKHKIAVLVKNFTHPNPILQKDFCELLRYQEYPIILINVTQSEFLENNQEPKHFKLGIELTIAGVKKSYLVNSKIETNNNHFFEINGKQTISLSDFGIEPPSKFFGLIKVNDNVEVNFSFKINNPQYYSHEVQY